MGHKRAVPVAQCTIGDFGVTLRSDSQRVLDDFASLYPPASGDDYKSDRTINIEVREGRRSRIGRRLFRVFADGQEIGGWRADNGVFPFVEWGINLRIMATRPEFLQLHAASMSFQGHGFIFAGDSGCGKSTLAAILLARGWQYLCDEFALVDLAAMRLQPFPKALCIKAGSYETVRQLGLSFARRRDYLKELKGRVGYINPKTGRGGIGRSAPVRVVVFPRYNRNAQPRLEPISRAEAAMCLYRCCFNRHAFTRAAVPALSRMIEQCACFRLTVGSPGDTVRLLESCLAGDSNADAQTPLVSKERSIFQKHARPRSEQISTRREVLRIGAKLAYVTPAVLTLTAHQAFAMGSNPSGICSTAMQTGELCESDADCCSRDCDFGLCK